MAKATSSPKPTAADANSSDANSTAASQPRAPPARGITSFISLPVLLLGIVVGLVSFAIDYVPAPIEPVALQFNYTARTLEQQAHYRNGVGRVPNSVVFESAQTVLEGEALAPEDLAIAPDGKAAFAGLRDGRIVYFTTEGKGEQQTVKMHELGRVGGYKDTCGDAESEPWCGRPLALTFVRGSPFTRFVQRIEDARYFYNSMMLLIVDAYRGVLLMDARGRTTKVFDGLGGVRRFKFLNGVAVTQNGEIYVTQSSSRFARNKVTLDNLERQPTGRLIHFDPLTLRVSVLAENLAFPNGLTLVDDEQALLIAMTFQNKLVKYDIKKKTIEDFAFVPGMPDNLWVEKKRPGMKNSKDVLFVGLVRLQPWWYEYVFAPPKIRKLMTQVMTLDQIREFASPHGAFVKVDLESGNVTHVYEDRAGIARFTSGVKALGSHYYLTSWARDSLVRIPKKAFN